MKWFLRIGAFVSIVCLISVGFRGLADSIHQSAFYLSSWLDRTAASYEIVVTRDKPFDTEIISIRLERRR